MHSSTRRLSVQICHLQSLSTSSSWLSSSSSSWLSTSQCCSRPASLRSTRTNGDAKTKTNTTGCLSSRTYATVTGDEHGASSSSSSASSSAPPKNPYPYPRHAKPTPYQIFHLPVSATQAEIKARYYELVKAHHPDSHHASRIASDIAHTRFRNIQAAYDFLRGRTLSPHPNARPTPAGGTRGFDPYVHEMARRRRAYYASHSRGYDDAEEDGDGKGGGRGWRSDPNERTMWHEDGWRERLIFGLGMMASIIPLVLAGLFPNMPVTIASTFMPTTFSASPTPPLSSVQDRATTATTNATTKPPSSNTNSFPLPFVIDLDKGHREAVSALVEARNERETLGAERREGVRQRVREIKSANGDVELTRGVQGDLDARAEDVTDHTQTVQAGSCDEQRSSSSTSCSDSVSP
ncbi:hypothetical protein JR316_0007737 [Psilocybe cubensis]|uniref:J domain-containing protein n=2 Tax=Psilocybe cubensis TaxID=181762 RepID=A0A8H7XUZ9_PSICU|nr:hypothetical protein JR316_0007737 [Psilocybe cubensis]KAH9479154.1 hypothetical protein JR316_0007737 [Psilocybe cubensis]